MITAEQLIHHFKLEPHPEGGYYKRTFLSEDDAFSSILFLLTKDNFSAFHKIESAEQWNWYFSDAVIIHEINAAGNYTKTILNNQPEQLNFQYVVKGGNWFASECSGDSGFALCGCTVVPAFQFAGFELASRSDLIKSYPQHSSLITQLTRL
ncbi:MAG: cupin domain-containing protein [Chitinophagales bacterium]